MLNACQLVTVSSQENVANPRSDEDVLASIQRQPVRLQVRVPVDDVTIIAVVVIAAAQQRRRFVGGVVFRRGKSQVVEAVEDESPGGFGNHLGSVWSQAFH